MEVNTEYAILPQRKPNAAKPAFNARPNGAKAPSPGQASTASDTPGFARARPIRPNGAKAATGGLNASARKRVFVAYNASCGDKRAPVPAFAPLGRIGPIVRNPGCRIASLACPGLGAHYPFGVPVERMVSASPYRSSPVARMACANPYRSSSVARMACAVPFPRNAHETLASRAPFVCKII